MVIHSTFSIPVTLTIDYTDSNQTCAHIFGLVRITQLLDEI